LSNESFSIAADVGIYLGEVLRKQRPALRWALCTRPKSDISYNLPVLEGGKMPVDPIHLAVVLAYGIARGTRGPDRLSELYRIWIGEVT
jgi:hypothetical protein